jgi:hypothetical protein
MHDDERSYYPLAWLLTYFFVFMLARCNLFDKNKNEKGGEEPTASERMTREFGWSVLQLVVASKK